MILANTGCGTVQEVEGQESRRVPDVIPVLK